MKYFLFTVLALFFIITGCVMLSGNLTGGEIFEGTGLGFRGPVTVQVRMIGNDITEIIIVDSQEDRFVGTAAMEELLDLVILYNTTDVDAVSGATESSRGFLEAVENAIMKR
jgi:urocanate reductase